MLTIARFAQGVSFALERIERLAHEETPVTADTALRRVRRRPWMPT